MPALDARPSSSQLVSILHSPGDKRRLRSAGHKRHLRFKQVVRFRSRRAAEEDVAMPAPVAAAAQPERPVSPAPGVEVREPSPEVYSVRSESPEAAAPQAAAGGVAIAAAVGRLADDLSELELSRAERHTLRAERLRQQQAAKAREQRLRIEEEQRRLLERRRRRRERAARDRQRLREELVEVPPPNAVWLIPDDDDEEQDVKPHLRRQPQQPLARPYDSLERCHGVCRTRPSAINDGEWEVDEVVDHMVQRGRLFFAIKWQGYPLGHCGAFDLWNPAENVHCPHLIQLYFHSRGIAPDRMPYQEQWNF